MLISWILILLFLLPAGGVALEGPLRPDLRSYAAALYDFETETLLFAKNEDRPLPPASMTKLMTLHLVYRAIDAGGISPQQMVVIDEKGDFRRQPRGSSLMFLEADQRVTVFDLMRGLAVPSGNDAARVLAELVSGTVEAFVEEMNREAARLGLEELYFADPAGLSEKNSVTAESFARFCMYYIDAHPEALSDLHSIEVMTYPEERNISAGAPAVYGPITQENYNVLIGRYSWADGLKTGYIDESGYNIALTAQADGRRLVAVLLGGPGENSREGAFTRAVDGVNLLSYGFYAFRRVEPGFFPDKPLRVWKGTKGFTLPEAFTLPPMVLPAVKAGALCFDYEIDGPLIAPVVKGQRVGTARLTFGDEILGSYPLRAAEEIPPGSLIREIRDSMRLFLRKVFPWNREEEGGWGGFAGSVRLVVQ